MTGRRPPCPWWRGSVAGPPPYSVDLRLGALLLVAVAWGCASSGPPPAVAPIVGAWPLRPAQVLLSESAVRMRLDLEEGSLAVGASWEARGLDERGPRLRSAWLVPVEPRLQAEVGEKWRPVATRGPDSWHQLLAGVGDRFVSSRAGEATRLVLEGAAPLLVRLADGRVRKIPGGHPPADVTVTREVTQAVFLAELLRSPGTDWSGGRVWAPEPVMLPVSAADRHGGFLLLDPERQLAVVLPHPGGFQLEREGTGLGRTVETISAVTLEAHGLALLKNPVSAAGRLVNSVVQLLAGAAASGLSTGHELPLLAEGDGMDLVAWERELDRLTGTTSTRGSTRLLVDGDEYFPLLEQRIREARTSVDVRVNIFDTDDVAVGIADLLRERSQEIRVRVLVDRLSTLGAVGALPSTPMPAGFRMPASITRYLRSGSRVKVRSFLNPWGSSDHTKVLLFDRRFAHLGGMNVGREYRHEWHDLMVELEGPVVGSLGLELDRAWAHAGVFGDLGFLVTALFTRERFEGEEDRDDYEDLRLLHTRTGDPQIYVATMAALDRAQREIWLENPYLWDNSVVDALLRARQRGVDVRVILPAKSDLGLGDLSNMVTANVLLENGVRVFVHPGMTHVKALLVDGWACLGSANFNALSLRRNLETNVATADPGFVEALRERVFEADAAVSHELMEPVEPGPGARFAAWVMNHF